MRGQASVELLTILAIGLVVLAVIIATSKSAFEDAMTSYSSGVLSNDLSYISKLATDLYYRGQPGSYSVFLLHVPNTVLPENSSFEDNLVVYVLEQKYGLKEVPQPFEVPVEWMVPFTPGDHEVYIISEVGRIRIVESPSFIIQNYGPNSIMVYNPTYDTRVVSLYSNGSFVSKYVLDPRSTVSINVSGDRLVSDDGYSELMG